ncbi:MAG: type II secretion system F family protein, partial [Oscillospiraceae bacterium]|nr:type II secretion system F family protein [Oscillospiraceae bacterium]
VPMPDYTSDQLRIIGRASAFAAGFALGFAVLFIFYRILPLSIFGGGIYGAVNIFVSSKNAVAKRKDKLRIQFFDLLESMSVAMKAGNPPSKALESARGDLALIYPENSDIIKELDIIIGKFNNAVPLSEIFANFAKRSGIEDIAGFASVYATIEGKSSRSNEIVRETQQIIADKMEIEMEIDTMMSAAKAEVNIMLILPLVILAVISYAGAGFMDVIYDGVFGRVVATGGLLLFIASYIMARIFSNIKL